MRNLRAHNRFACRQCIVSGSGLDSDSIRIQLAQRIRIRIGNLDPDPGWPKLAPKNLPPFVGGVKETKLTVSDEKNFPSVYFTYLVMI